MPSKKRPNNPRLPQISDAEWIVMKVLWDRAPLTTNQVVEALADQTSWKPKTIHTLLRRLVLKSALDFEKQGREYRFTPRASAQDCSHAASRSFLSRVFDGKLAPFLAGFLEKGDLSREEIDELKRILNQKRS